MSSRDLVDRDLKQLQDLKQRIDAGPLPSNGNAVNNENLKPWKKGQSGNPSGGKRKILPEVQRAIDANRNALKVLILTKLEGRVEEWVSNIIEQGIGDADIIKFKMLIELALGKMVDDPPEFPVSEEERILILEYRRRKLERERTQSISDPVP